MDGKKDIIRKGYRQTVSCDAIRLLTDSFNDVGQENSITHVSLQVVDQPFAARPAQIVVRPVCVNLHKKSTYQFLRTRQTSVTSMAEVASRNCRLEKCVAGKLFSRCSCRCHQYGRRTRQQITVINQSDNTNMRSFREVYI
jgi:hypothetical protein